MTKRVSSVAKTGLLLVLSLAAVGLANCQTTQTPKTSSTPATVPATTKPDEGPAVSSELQSRLTGLQAEQALLYEKLHGLTEFQQFMQVTEALQRLQAQIRQAPPAANH